MFEQLDYNGFTSRHPKVIAIKKEFDEKKSQLVKIDEAAKKIHEINCEGFIHKALGDQLALADFDILKENVIDIFELTKELTGGKVADYIPQLAKVDPHKYGISVCSVDGQQISLGDAYEGFSVQSITKPFLYSLALEECGVNVVHEHIGCEPSGHSFNEITVDSRNRPHNPMINAGGIMSSAFIKPLLPPSERFDYMMDTWKKLGLGGSAPEFNESVYLSEKETGYRNFALTYFMEEKGAFPLNTNALEVLDFYFKCCSVEMTCESMAIVAATLARSGRNPFSNEQIFSPDSVKNCLSMMHSCGMYDYSGEFAFTIGLPAKSGVGGGLLVIVPHLMGFCIWSPLLDKYGNTVKGIEFCKRMTDRFNFHVYDSLLSESATKIDPRSPKYFKRIENVMMLCFAAVRDDTNEINRIISSGVSPDIADYDGRTALQVAVNEGSVEAAKLLLSMGADPDYKNRWGHTSFSYSQKSDNPHIKQLFRRD